MKTWLWILLISSVVSFGEPPATAQVAEAEPCQPVVVEEFAGKAVGISDGDTIRVLKADKTTVRVRLEGIDAPESGQDHGTKAKQALSELVGEKQVTIKKTGEDRYGRTLAYVFVDGVDVNARLVEDGWAWHYTEFNCEERLGDLETVAREARRGLWAHERPEPPWEYRALMAERRAAAKARQLERRTKPSRPEPQPAEEAVETVYWLNTSSNVRHNSGCRWFKNTKRGRACKDAEGKACGICGG